MFTIIKFNKFFAPNSIRLRKLTSDQLTKISGNIEKSKNTLPQLNLMEHLIKITINTLFAPFGICSVKQNHIMPYFTFGKYDGYRTSGLTWYPSWSVKHEIFCGDMTMTHSNMHLTDSSSNPIRVSSFIIYNITNPVNRIVNLESDAVLSNWIENIVRKFISSFSYDDLTSVQKENLTDKLVEIINGDPKAEFYGIEIQKAGLLEINYATEIAETMLVKQKAKATIEARKELVDATIGLINNISSKLNDELYPSDKSKLITYLAVSMIGNNSPSQVISLN